MEMKTSFTEFMAAAAKAGDRGRKFAQRGAIRRMLRRGQIDSTTAAKLEAMDWQSFLEWILENAPAIIEFIMQLLMIFGV